MTGAILDRYEGCLVGAALGDALGAAYEFKSGIFGVTTEFKRGVFGTPPGGATDDSTLMGLLADSLIENNGLVEADYMDRLVKWLESNPPDVGNQTSRAIRHWRDKRETLRPDENARSNGAVMVCAPIGLMFGKEYRAGAKAVELSGFTHPSSASAYACSEVASAVSRLVVGDHDGVFDVPKPAGWRPDGPDMGYCQGTASVAFLALSECGHPADAVGMLLTVIGLGGDTDTNACVAGALLGAKFGMAAWPTDMVDQLEVGEAMRARARKLYGLALHS